MRQKLIDAILEENRKIGSRNQNHVLEESLKRVRDLDLITLAASLGIDTDALLELCENCREPKCVCFGVADPKFGVK